MPGAGHETSPPSATLVDGIRAEQSAQTHTVLYLLGLWLLLHVARSSGSVANSLWGRQTGVHLEPTASKKPRCPTLPCAQDQPHIAKKIEIAGESGLQRLQIVYDYTRSPRDTALCTQYAAPSWERRPQCRPGASAYHWTLDSAQSLLRH